MVNISTWMYVGMYVYVCIMYLLNLSMSVGTVIGTYI